MADPAIGQVTASVWEKVVGGGPEDVVFTSQAFLALLKRFGGFKKESGGSQIECTLEYAENSTMKSYSDLETLDTTRVDVFDAARFSWKEVGGTIVYSELEKARASGDSQKFDLIASKVNNGKNSMLAVINRMLYSDGTGNSSKDISGLDAYVVTTPTSGTVGGINRALFTWWRNRSNSAAKASTTYDNLRSTMRTTYNECSKGASAEHPEYFLFDSTTFGGYEGTLTANERFTTDAKTGVVDGGFRNEMLKFKGAVVTFDEDCAAATGYCLNARNLRLHYLQWLKAFAPVDPANQHAEIVKLLTIAQASINNPRRVGKLYNCAS